MAKSKPVEPVTPSGMTVVFYYDCPACKAHLPMQAPTQPAVLTCPNCGQRFPIVPVDEATLQFMQIMTDDGRAAANPDYL